MATQQQIAGNWNQLKGLIREHWAQLTDDELHEVHGDFDQVVGLIQQKTGEARAQIEETLDKLTQQCTGVFENATEKAREYIEQTSEIVSDAAEQMRDRLGSRYSEAATLVKRHPAESIAVAFGAGLVVGVIVGLVSRSR